MVTSKNLQKDDTTSKVEVFKQSPTLAHLSEGELSELAALATRRHFAKGDFIFHEGDIAESFYAVEEGRVKLFKESPSGKNFILDVAHRGDTLHAFVLFDAKPRWLSAQAMGEVTVLCVTREKFLSFVIKHPSIAMKIIGILGEQVHSAHDRLRDIVADGAEQRLINVLHMLYSKFGTTLFFTAEDIADLAGTTRETIERMMSRLKNSGLVSCTRGRIVILDQTKLQTLSSGPYLI